jgi:phosphate:Na+ symporter
LGHEVVIDVAGGVALLLWAARMVKTGVLRAYGGRLRQWLAHALTDPLRAFAVGCAVSIAVQSSTAVALIMAGFARKGLVSAGAGFVVLLGAGLGSALVVQVLAFDVQLLSPLLILAGVGAFLACERPLVKQLGRATIGLGLLILALHLIVQSAEGLAASAGMTAVLEGAASDPYLAIALGAAIGWLSHSSIATVLLVLSLVSAHVVQVPLALELVLGANLGAALVCVTLTLRLPRVARHAPLLNLMNRSSCIVLAVPLLPAVAHGLAWAAGSATQQVASFHLLFNALAALLSLPFREPLGRLAERLLPAVGGSGSAGPEPRHLDDADFERPALALGAAAREAMRLADATEAMLTRSLSALEAVNSTEIDRLSRLDDDIDALHEAIKLYVARLSREPLSEAESRRCLEILEFATNLEHVGDIIDKNLLELARKKLKRGLGFSPTGWSELQNFHREVVGQLQLAITVFLGGDLAVARRMVAAKQRFRDLERASVENHLARLRSGNAASLESSALHLDVLRDLKRISAHLIAVAYPALDAHGELRGSRLRCEGASLS